MEAQNRVVVLEDDDFDVDDDADYADDHDHDHDLVGSKTSLSKAEQSIRAKKYRSWLLSALSIKCLLGSAASCIIPLTLKSPL